MTSAIIAALLLSVTPVTANPFNHNTQLQSVTTGLQSIGDLPVAPPSNDPKSPAATQALLKADLAALVNSLTKAFKGTVTLGEVRASPGTGMVLARVDASAGTDNSSAVYLMVFDPKSGHFLPLDFFVPFDINAVPSK